MHIHKDRVKLPNGPEVLAASYDFRAPYDRDAEPDFGLYLDTSWTPPWPHQHVNWPDFGLPLDRQVFADNLNALLHRVATGQRVEVGCIGGHGRTGTTLACLAVLTGIDPQEACAWVRKVYCSHAVETSEQEAFVIGFNTSR